MCDRISTWPKDAAVENGPIPLGARALATRMRDLGTGCTRPDISWCGERRTPRKGLALDRDKKHSFVITHPYRPDQAAVCSGARAVRVSRMAASALRPARRPVATT